MGRDYSQHKIQDFLKPRRGKIQQGYYTCKNPDKYVGDLSKIVYRSSWEFKFLRWCDNTPAVKKFSSEPFSIPYLDPVDKRVHNYFIDYWMELEKEDGTLQRWIVEVKPARHVAMPDPPKNQTAKSLANHISQVKRVMKNIAKFQAARNYAKQQKMKFAVLRLNRTTEKFEFVKWEKGAEDGL